MGAFQISDAVFKGLKSVSGQTTVPTGVFVSPDGVRMYVCGSVSVYQYALSTPFDITTATFVQSFSTGTVNTSDVFFTHDGTRMFVSVNGSSGDALKHYTLSTPWDISTASLSQSLAFNNIEGAYIRADGLKMYIATTSTAEEIHEYTLGTAWDISSGTLVSSLDVTAIDSNISGVWFKSDGTRMFVVGNANNSIYQFELSAAWTVSTASQTDSLSVATEDATPEGICIDNAGDNMYVAGNSDNDVNWYKMGGFIPNAIII